MGLLLRSGLGSEAVMKLKTSCSGWRTERISVLLTAVAVLLWLHSILSAKLEIGFYGLIHGLPVTFFVALAFLTVASAILWVSSERHGKLLCLQLLVFISALWLIPVITGGSPPFVDHEYRVLGMVDYIVRQGHFDPTVLWYQAWPGAFIISAMAFKVGSIDLEPVLGMFPFFMQLLYLLPLYLFLKNTLGEARSNYCWAGAWLFYLANWIGQDYFGPQAIALFLLLTLLALVTSASVWKKDSKSPIFLGLVVLVFAALAITHLLTALAALCILVAIWLVKRSKTMALAVVLCLLLVVCWDSIGAERFIMNRVFPAPGSESPGAFVVDPGAVTGREVTGHFTGSESHVAVAITRLPFSAMFALIGVAGVVLVLLVKRKLGAAIPILAIALAPLLLLPLAYGQELLHRLYLFALAPMAYFGAELLSTKKRELTFIFCLSLIIGVPLHVVAHYGNEAMDYFSPGDVAGLHFFHDNTSEGYVTGAWPMGEVKNVERYRLIGFSRLSLQNDVVVVEGQLDEESPHYIAISRQDREFYRFFLDDPGFIEELELNLNNSADHNLIYLNADVSLYVHKSSW